MLKPINDQINDRFKDSIPFIMEGQVVSTNDPDQMGRVKIWVPSLDGETFDIDKLPWAEYASPFLGFTTDYPGGSGDIKNPSQTAYGFWAIPKIGATVLIFCLNANPLARFYFASTARLHRNRSLPAGRNQDFKGNNGPFGDDGDGTGTLYPLQPAYDNLREQFQNKITSSQAITRGFYERQVAQAKDDKDGKEGYSDGAVDSSYLDSQTICIVTPGRHAIIMQDDPAHARLRVKTGNGHQIILDDANERIYISTCKGKNWIELDADGHIHMFGTESISLRTGKDFNIYADGNINFEAGKEINIKANNSNINLSSGASVHVKATENIFLSACSAFDIVSEKGLHLSATKNLDIKSGSQLALTGTNGVDIHGGPAIKNTAGVIHQNGAPAKKAEDGSCANSASGPAIVPGYEPWTRPKTSGKRGSNWKE